MRRNPHLFRLTASVALTALLWGSVLPPGAFAQPAPPPLPSPGQRQPDVNQGDPPARVGRLAGITGAVSFHNPGDTQWSAVGLNYPVSTGNSFWTEPSATADLEISDSRIVMGGGTEFDVSTLDAGGLQAVASQGETYLHLRDLAPNEVWSLQTPRGLVRLGGDGRYDIVVGSTDQPTLVTVLDGAAQIEAPGVSLQVGAGQSATITGTDTFQGSIGPAIHDAFLSARLDAERPPPAPAVAVPAQVALMPGGTDLLGVGSWSDAPQYGQVWYPPVSPDWVPYREGHWDYVAPWGWTWIDNASWGFAPFHYGRWIQIGGRWAWTPGEIAAAGPPVYAPALVTFIGIGAGVALGAALAAGTIGWVPLGPREPFHPWYHASNNYLRQVNIAHVTNFNTNVTINNYVNRGAATSIPTAAMTASRPVAAVARPISAEQLAAARPIVGHEPIRPTAATAGITPGVARQLNLPPAATGRPAPGPAVRPPAAGARGTGFVRPALAPAGTHEPGTPARPSAAPGTPPTGRPALTTPGARPEGLSTPQAARPAQTPPAAARPGEPGTARPGVAPTASRPAQATPAVPPRPAPRSEPGAQPQVAAPARAEPQHAAPPAPQPQVHHAAPPAPQPEAQRPAPPAPRAPPPRAAPPAAAHPAAPARPEQPQHEKHPGEP